MYLQKEFVSSKKFNRFNHLSNGTDYVSQILIFSTIKRDGESIHD